MHATELAFRVANECLQLHGGYGYLKNAPIGKILADQRVTRIYGGANEIMLEIIAKGLGFTPQRPAPPRKVKAAPAASKL